MIFSKRSADTHTFLHILTYEHIHRSAIRWLHQGSYWNDFTTFLALSVKRETVHLSTDMRSAHSISMQSRKHIRSFLELHKPHLFEITIFLISVQAFQGETKKHNFPAKKLLEGICVDKKYQLEFSKWKKYISGELHLTIKVILTQQRGKKHQGSAAVWSETAPKALKSVATWLSCLKATRRWRRDILTGAKPH